MTEEQRYHEIDIPFYRKNVLPVLPETVLDFHAHVRDPRWERQGCGDGEPGAKYMVFCRDYPSCRLMEDGRRIFAEREYECVCFGWPLLSADPDPANRWFSSEGRLPGMHPLALAGRGLKPKEILKREIVEGRFSGYKVIIPWTGNAYGRVTVEEMIGPDEMELADELNLVVLLHVPGERRLADREVQKSVERYAREYPSARIVLAHCGRCYLPDEMMEAVSPVAALENVYFDTSMVMDASVIQILLEHVDARRVLFATDFPIASMRGRRVYAMDHWIDVVLEGYPESDYRVTSSGIRATFMAYEIVLAIRRGARMAGISENALRGIFCDNGFALLENAGVRS